MTRALPVPTQGCSPTDEVASTSAISPIEAVIEDARNGRPYILVEADDRDSPGDVVIAAQFATPSQVNFMARHARGLIRLAIPRERAQLLRLPPMSRDNQFGRGGAFTISVEAREGVTTGISAHDRARTIAVAVDPSKGADDLVSPGHIFPLVAQDGGVVVRAGHAEAAVDMSRLAGLNPAGVICEIMNEDGSVARLPQLFAFARQHRLKIGAIADLIALRRRTERQVELVIETAFESIYGGVFRLMVYRNLLDRTEHVVLTKGEIARDKPTLVRLHKVDPVADMLGQVDVRHDLIPRALDAIAAFDGAGAAVLVRSSNPDHLSQKYSGSDPSPQETAAWDFGIGAQILLDLGVRDIILLTGASTSPHLPDPGGQGIHIVERRRF